MSDNPSPEIGSDKQKQELKIARLQSQIHELTVENRLLEQQLSQEKQHLDRVYADRLQNRTESAQDRQFLQTVLAHLPGGIIIAEAASGKSLFSNNCLANIFRRETIQIDKFEDYLTFGLLEDDDSLSRWSKFPLAKALANNPVRGEEMRYLCGDRVIRTLFVNSVPIYDPHGTIIAAIATFYDITNIKRTKSAQPAANKSIFLKEIHHRLKNNLQIVSALLDLQSEQVQDRLAYSLLEKSQARIQTMALIHEKIYSSDNIEKIDFSDYVTSLTRYLYDSFIEDYKQIELVLDIESIQLNIDLATPCGLIINELVVNSLQHGFKNRDRGRIEINFFLDRQNQYNLQIADNGSGINPQIYIKNNPEFLGISMVESLVTEQLRGSWQSSSRNGCVIQITFPQT